MIPPTTTPFWKDVVFSLAVSSCPLLICLKAGGLLHTLLSLGHRFSLPLHGHKHGGVQELLPLLICSVSLVKRTHDEPIPVV